MALSSGGGKAGSPESSLSASQVSTPLSSIVAGAVSTSTTAASAVSGPTPYSDVTADQYEVAPTLPRKSMICASFIASSSAKKTGTTWGAVSTGPPRSATCGGAGNGAGYTLLTCPPSPPTPVPPTLPTPPVPPTPTVTTPTVVVVVVEVLPPLEELSWRAAEPQAEATVTAQESTA